MVGIYCAFGRVNRKTLLKLSRQAESVSGINGSDYRNKLLKFAIIAMAMRDFFRSANSGRMFADISDIRGGGR